MNGVCTINPPNNSWFWSVIICSSVGEFFYTEKLYRVVLKVKISLRSSIRILYGGILYQLRSFLNIYNKFRKRKFLTVLFIFV